MQTSVVVNEPRISTGLFKPGHNCWTVAHARRASVLIDAENYYRAFISALEQAQESVIILAWDIDTRVNLVPNQKDQSLTLENVLARAIERNPRLHAYILCWNFAMIYTFERQLFPRFQRIFKHPRVHFVLDGHHPLGASQHQKVIVVDDSTAFIGGLDICAHRWDTRNHGADDPDRVDHTGKHYHPFHDVQAVVEGEAAEKLAILARERWHMATGGAIPWAVARNSAWPEGLRADFENINLAISRTRWSLGVERPIHEIENLYVDSIMAAKRHIYIENQYFTSDRIADAIAARLPDPACPEILVILPRFNSGWVEQSTMGILRLRVMQRLQSLDRHRKLRFYYPVARGLRDAPISLHSKLMIVDGQLLRMGSSNLSNRSMGLDTEADIAIEANGDPKIENSIARIRDVLLAEHLGAWDAAVSQSMREFDSLFALVDHFNALPSAPRYLEKFNVKLHPVVNAIVPGSIILDPEHPIEEDPLFTSFMPKDIDYHRREAVQRLQIRLGLALALAVSIAAWRRDLIKRVPELGARRTLALFALGTLARMRPDILIFMACTFQGTLRGMALSFAGLGGSATTMFLIGRLLTQRAYIIEREQGGVMLRSTPRQSGWAHFLLNASTIAPLATISYRAGKMHSSTPRFVAGTLAGQSFRIVAVGLYCWRLKKFVEKPNVGTTSTLLGATLCTFSLFRWASRRFIPTYRNVCDGR